jgi:hypothetical protein
VGDYVYQPTRVLQSVADLVEEVKTGKAPENVESPALGNNRHAGGKLGTRHQTDVLALYKPRPRPAMTK